MNNRLIIEAANAEWNKALNSGNVKDLATLYTENAILSPGNGVTLVGRAEIEGLFKSFVDAGVHNHTLEIIELGGSDKMIYQVARWNAQGAEANGETPSFGGITTSVLEQSADGNWVACTHVWNVNQ
jgi:ketosteroid isomerase-like protein